MVTRTLSDLIFFVTKTESIDPLTCEGLPDNPRQKLMREQGLHEIEILMDCLRAPFENDPYTPYALSELTQGHFITEIGQLLYRLLHHMSKEYRRNEFVLTPNIDFFVQQSCETGDENDLFSEAILTGLVSNNQTLLEEYVGFNELKLFCDDVGLALCQLLTLQAGIPSLPLYFIGRRKVSVDGGVAHQDIVLARDMGRHVYHYGSYSCGGMCLL